MWYWCSNASPAAGASRMSMPAKRTPRERVSPATRGSRGTPCLLGVGESPAGQVIGVDQDLVGEPAVRAEGQLGPDAGAGEPQQQDLLPPAAPDQVGHRSHAAGVGLGREELAAADTYRVRRAGADGGVAGDLLVHGYRRDLAHRRDPAA